MREHHPGFHKGNNSAENFQELDNFPTHFIGSLVPPAQDLLDIPLQKFMPWTIPLSPGASVSTEKEVFGRKRTTRHPPADRALLRGQIRGIRAALSKKLRALRDLQKRIPAAMKTRLAGQALHVASIQKI